MKIFRLFLIIIFTALLFPDNFLAQERVTLRGTAVAQRVGVHRGNQVRTVFSNYGVIAQPGAEGPQGAWKYDTNGYVGDVSPLVGLQLPVKDYTNDGIPDTVHSVIITEVDRPGGGEGGGGKAWGFEPIPDFFNPSVDEVGKGVAMSHQPETWPVKWPDQPTWSYSGSEIIKNGIDITPSVDWNGYFGRAQMNSDQESYFWMDDYQDEEVQQRFGFIPDTTDPTRTGQALQASVRGLQWSNFLAQDVIFWLYNIKNDGTAVYDKAVFAILVGTYVGLGDPEWNDDASFFNVRESITYTWDFDHYISPSANPQWQPDPRAVGYIAYAFLESPGNPYDGIDNDGDDQKYGGTSPLFEENSFESRTVNAGDKLVLIDKDTFERTIFTVPNQNVSVTSMGVSFIIQPGVTQLVEGDINATTTNVNPNSRDGIDNDLDGLIDENYQVHYRQYKKSTDGTILIDTLAPVQYVDYMSSLENPDVMLDEARDDGIDNDGDWDPEFDDVGKDGKPDTGDPGEGDGVPTAGEPNFDATDVDESDQIGLTSFEYFVPAGDITMSNDEDLWSRLTPGFFEVPSSVVNNVATRGEDGDFIYGAGYFPLLPGKTERFSLALAFGDDYPAVLKTKQIAQTIYNANYNFPRPPDKPTLTAVAGDGKVTLYWDRVAESSVDPTLKVKDFEGYKIYKGTDPDFTDALQITDGSGVKKFYEPIVQFDLINGLTGYFAPGQTLRELTNAIPFYLGSDNGIQNFYVDNDVINGRTYYYALVAYDRGDASKDIFPSENTRFVSKDALGRISTDINTVAVVPNAPVIGYEPPENGIELGRVSGASTADIYYEVMDPTRIEDTSYTVTFNDELVDSVPIAQSYNISYANSDDYVIKNAPLSSDNGDVVNGVRLSINTNYQSVDSIKLNPEASGWNNSDSASLKIQVSRFTSTIVNGIKRPNNYVIVFDDTYNDSSYSLEKIFGNRGPKIVVSNFKVYDITDPQNPQPIHFAFSESPTSTFRKDTLSYLDQVTLSNEDGTEITWKIVMIGDSSSSVPKAGDSLFVSLTKPFSSKDVFTYSTSTANYDALAAKEELDNIRVVPNPYVVTNVFEQPLPANVRGRGERVINFINLPPKCKIHIFSSSGSHIRTLEHDGNIHNGSVTWDVRTKEGLELAYGVYFYVVEVEGISDKKTGKIAIIK